jgi:hypothetical protein
VLNRCWSKPRHKPCDTLADLGWRGIGLVKSVKSHRYRPRARSTPDFSVNVTPAMCRALNGEVCGLCCAVATYVTSAGPWDGSAILPVKRAPLAPYPEAVGRGRFATSLGELPRIHILRRWVNKLSHRRIAARIHRQFITFRFTVSKTSSRSKIRLTREAFPEKHYDRKLQDC